MSTDAPSRDGLVLILARARSRGFASAMDKDETPRKPEIPDRPLGEWEFLVLDRQNHPEDWDNHEFWADDEDE